ncbi:MAG: hypothetical protein HQL07_16205 [Nitrospirae bacterium]|nr:hypothetical protein [Magnetococcales bacterium]
MNIKINEAVPRKLWESGPMNSDIREGLYSEYIDNRSKAEFLMQQVYTRHIDMNSQLACELERLLERISGQDRRISMM